MEKWLKLKVGEIWELIPGFVEVTGEKLVGGLFSPLPPPYPGKGQHHVNRQVVFSCCERDIFHNFLLS